MKKLLMLGVMAAGAALGSARALAGDAGAPAPKAEPRLEFIYLEMTGATGLEVAAIAKSVGAVEGVRTFTWTAEGTEAKVVREAGKARGAALIDAARASGAETAGVVPVAATNFTFEKQLHCGGCVSEVNKALLELKGMKEVLVSAAMTDVTAVYDTRAVKPGDIEATLAKIEKPAKQTAQ